jgi:hypothetical protein
MCCVGTELPNLIENESELIACQRACSLNFACRLFGIDAYLRFPLPSDLLYYYTEVVDVIQQHLNMRAPSNFPSITPLSSPRRLTSSTHHGSTHV